MTTVNSSGSFNVSTSNQYISGKINWSAVTNYDTNQSTITMKLYMSRTNSGFTTLRRPQIYFHIDTSSQYKDYGSDVTITQNSNTYCGEWSKTITHNADGSRKCNLDVSGILEGSTDYTVSAPTKEITLPKVPRASSISSFANFLVNGSSAVSISSASTSFTHALQLYVGGKLISSWSSIGASTNISLTDGEQNQVYDTLTSTNNSATATLRCYTYDGGVSVGDYTTKTATITKPNASTISGSNFTIGNSVPYSISSQDSMFEHDIVLKYGSTVIASEIYQISGANSIILTTTQENTLYNLMKNTTSATLTLECSTYGGIYSDVKIGNTTSTSLIASVSSSIVPSFTTVTHSENVSAINSNIGEYVQGLSKLNLAITGAIGNKYSTITSYKIVFDGTTYNSSSATTGFIKGSGTLNAVATITDSRGRTASKTIPITVLPYAPPQITGFTVDRCNSDGSLNPLGTYAKVVRVGSVSSLNSKNNYTYTIYSKLRGTSTWTSKSTGSSALGVITMNASNVVSSYGITESHDFRLDLTDKFNTTISLVVLATGEVAMSLGKSGIGVGKIHEQGALDVGGDAFISGQVNANVMNPNAFARLTSWASQLDGKPYSWNIHLDGTNALLGYTNASGVRNTFNITNHTHDYAPTVHTHSYLGLTAKASDSDKLDGYHGSSDAYANYYALRDASADINARLFRSNYQNETGISGAIAYRKSTTDNYIRFCSSPVSINNWLGHGDSGWINLPLMNGATAYNTGLQPQYRKVGNVVQIQGEFKGISGASNASVQFGTIPVGYRPHRNVQLITQGSSEAIWLMTVAYDTGILTLARYREGAAYVSFTTSTWLPFNIVYLVA